MKDRVNQNQQSQFSIDIDLVSLKDFDLATYLIQDISINSKFQTPYLLNWKQRMQIKKRVADFVSDHQTTSTELAFPKEAELPLLQQEFEGGLASNHSNIPKQIWIDDKEFESPQIRMKANQIQYDIFRQSYFKIRAQSFHQDKDSLSIDQNEPTEFDISRLSGQLDSIALDISRQKLERIEVPEKTKDDPLNHILKYKKVRPDYDANKNQKLFDQYMKEFEKLVKKQKIYKVDSNELLRYKECNLQAIAKDILHIKDEDNVDENLSDQHDHGQPLIIHKTLLRSSKIDRLNSMMELRKVYYRSEKEEFNQLKLELAHFSFDDQEPKQRGTVLLHQFKGNESSHLFNDNFDCLFNHVQHRDHLFWFSVEESQYDDIATPTYQIHLNHFELSNEVGIQDCVQDSNFSLEISQTQIDEHIENGKLMGVIFIKGTHDIFNETDKTPKPCCFFALIYALEKEKSQKVCYDVRHITQPEKCLNRIFLPGTADSNKSKFFQDKQPVITQISAQSILDQMTMTGKMSKEERKRIISDLEMKRTQLFNKNKLQASLKQKSVDRKTQSINNLTVDMFIVGSLNDQEYDLVHDLFFIDNNLEVYKAGVMKTQDIQETKDMLVQCLQMLSFQNTCNIIKFDSFKGEIASLDKLKCRGQIELLKRLIGKQYGNSHNQNDQTKKQPIDGNQTPDNVQSNADLATNANEINIQDDNQSSQIEDAEIKNKNIKKLDYMDIDQSFKHYACASIIDNLNRVMIMNLYHKLDAKKSYFIQFPLKNLSQTWLQQDLNNSCQISEKDIAMEGYNQLFYEVFKQKNQNDDQMNPRLIISRKFDNIARDVQSIYLVRKNGGKCRLQISKDVEYSVTELRSYFQMIQDNPDESNLVASKLEKEPNKDRFIYSLIQENNNDNIKSNDQFQVMKFINFTNNQTRSHFKEFRQTQIEQEGKRATDKGLNAATAMKNKESELDGPQEINIDDEMMLEVKDKNPENKFSLLDRYVILQNCLFVEDDREDIPIVCIGKEYKSVQFAIIRYKEIKAIISLRVTQEEIRQNIDNKKSFEKNYPEFIQFCASSDIQEGYDLNGTCYMFQNYTVVIHFQKMMRFRMNEFQVKWIPNKDIKTKKQNPFIVKITLIRVRDVIFKRKLKTSSIEKYQIQPLFETQLESNKEKQIPNDKQQDEETNKFYRTGGIQFYLKLRGGQICYVNFRNLSVDSIDNEVTYNQRLFTTQTKFISQTHISGVCVETQFKNVVENDFTSDTINSNIFKDSQSYAILREANINGMNSIPYDFIGLMEMPLINDCWYQTQQKSSLEDNQSSAKVQTIDLVQSNYKRYLSPFQALNGFQMLNQLGLIESSNLDQSQHEFRSIIVKKEKEKEEKKGAGKAALQGIAHITTMFDDEVMVSRDPSQIVSIFGRMNKQQDDRQFDFKHLKDIRTSVFSMTLIDRALVNDDKPYRFQVLRKKGLIVDGKDPITSNMDLQSVMQYPLDCNDTKMTDIYLRELYENNTYSINKYSQMMRIMPLILSKKNYNSDDYFKFFYDSDMQFQNDDVDRKDVNEDDELIDDEVFKGEEIPEFITFSQFFPQNLQEQIDSYTDKKVQIFTEETTNNLINLTVTSTLRQQFNLIHNEYKSKGSKYEVKASHIDFKPFLLGKKLRALEKAQTYKEFEQVQEINMNDYELSKMMVLIMDSTKGKINEQKAIRDIVDQQYKSTQKFFYINLALYLVGYFFPLISQMKSGNKEKVLLYNMSCLVMQIYCLIYESISMISDGYKQYFSSWWNVVDCLTIVTYFVYFVFRMELLDKKILPVMPQAFEDMSDAEKKKLETDNVFRKNWQVEHFNKYYDKNQIDEYEMTLYSPIIHVMLIMTAFLKLMYYMRCNSAFGQFVQLVISCVSDVQIFSFFFISWVMIFSHLFMVVGSTFEDDDYPLLQSLTYYFQTYRNSIGDIAPPKYDFWVHMHELGKDKYGEHEKWGYSQCMIYMIWILWLLNQFFNLILLLNFLIAIVSQSYDRVISESINYQYSHKSELNEETQRFFKVFRKPASFDIMCIVSSHEDDQDQTDQIQGLSYTIKQYVKQLVGKLHEEVTNRFDRTDKMNEQQIEKLRKFIDEQFIQNGETISKVNKQLNQVVEKVNKGISQDEDEVGNAKKIEDMIRKSQIMLESVVKKQIEDNQQTQQIKSILADNSSRGQEEFKKLSEAQEKMNQAQKKMGEAQQNTDQALAAVKGQLEQTLSANKEMDEKLEQALSANKEMDDKLEQALSANKEMDDKLEQSLKANQEMDSKLKSALEMNEQIVQQLNESKQQIVNLDQKVEQQKNESKKDTDSLMQVVEERNSKLAAEVQSMQQDITNQLSQQKDFIDGALKDMQKQGDDADE